MINKTHFLVPIVACGFLMQCIHGPKHRNLSLNNRKREMAARQEDFSLSGRSTKMKSGEKIQGMFSFQGYTNETKAYENLSLKGSPQEEIARMAQVLKETQDALNAQTAKFDKDKKKVQKFYDRKKEQNEALTRENADLRKAIDKVEIQNSSLIFELKKLRKAQGELMKQNEQEGSKENALMKQNERGGYEENELTKQNELLKGENRKLKEELLDAQKRLAPYKILTIHEGDEGKDL